MSGMLDTPEQIGRFRIIGQIGRGGMATVYLAHDPRFQRDVAIKVLSSGLMQDPAFHARFDREARLVADLEHPNIVPVYDYGEEDGRPYLVMRMMRGRSLREKLRNGPLPPAEICELLTPLAGALDMAHRRGVVHRDIKPGNVLLDEEGRPYLADFGIARMTAQTNTATDIGTPENMSPEQATGGAIDSSTDIYQLGLLLFELLTGQKAFRADSRPEYMELHATKPVPALAEVSPTLPAEFDRVIQKATAKQAAARYQTAGALANDFCTLANRGRDNRWLYAAGLLAVFLIAFIAVQILLPGGLPGLFSGATATPDAQAAGQQTETPPSPDTPSPSRPPSDAQLGAHWVRPADNMPVVFVPGDTVLLGADEAEITSLLEECQTASGTGRCTRDLFTDTLPAHTVTLSPFWIDSYEVSNGQYRACVEAGVCAPPPTTTTDTRVAYYDEAAFADYPVVHVNWSEALTYCTWVGGVLPTEAQWEYAARGPERRTYPWGDLLQDNLANFCDRNCPFGWREAGYNDGMADTARVGSYGANDSWAGAFDLAGNVWEWTADWYGPYAATESVPLDPAGPQSGAERVIRGGSWAANSWYLWSAGRAGSPPDSRNSNLGFRCVLLP